MRVPVTPPDAAVSARGAACSAELPCASGLTCTTGIHAFGGYCLSDCASCDGACVGTASGEQCMAACTRDADCRVAEGYVCDRHWRACVMPNSTAIVPRECPAPRGIARDLAFAPTTTLAPANEAAAALLPNGDLVVLHAGGVTRVDVLGRPPITTPFAMAGRRPSLARDARGVLHAVWQESGVRYASSRDGVTWSQARPLDECSACRATVVAGDAVHVVIANDGIRVRTSRDGGKTFTQPAIAVLGGSANATLAAGQLHLAAIDGNALGAYGSAQQHVLYASTGRTVRVSRTDEVLPFYFGTPSVAVDTRRRWIYVAYVRGGRDAIWDIVLAASKDGGVTWTRTRIGDEGCAIHMVPNLAVDGVTGTLHVAWYDSRGGRRFARATCKPGLVGCVQVGRLDDAGGGTLSTVRDTPRSIGDAAALVVDEKRRLLHAVWTRPEGVTHAKAKLPLR